jgi:hypothetical protein
MTLRNAASPYPHGLTILTTQPAPETITETITHLRRLLADSCALQELAQDLARRSAETSALSGDLRAQRRPPRSAETSALIRAWLNGRVRSEDVADALQCCSADRRGIHAGRCSLGPWPGSDCVEPGPTPASWRSAPPFRTTPQRREDAHPTFPARRRQRLGNRTDRDRKGAWPLHADVIAGEPQRAPEGRVRSAD